jgi:hypothetical protein
MTRQSAINASALRPNLSAHPFQPSREKAAPRNSTCRISASAGRNWAIPIKPLDGESRLLWENIKGWKK